MEPEKNANKMKLSAKEILIRFRLSLRFGGGGGGGGHLSKRMPLHPMKKQQHWYMYSGTSEQTTLEAHLLAFAESLVIIFLRRSMSFDCC